jgi:hypothetical protein
MSSKLDDHSTRSRNAGIASGQVRRRQAQEASLAAHVEAVVSRAPELTITQQTALRTVLAPALNPDDALSPVLHQRGPYTKRTKRTETAVEGRKAS